MVVSHSHAFSLVAVVSDISFLNSHEMLIYLVPNQTLVDWQRTPMIP